MTELAAAAEDVVTRERTRRYGLRLLLVTLLYLLAAWGGLRYAVVGSTVSLVWAPSGIALAALLLWGHNMALGVLLGAFLANAGTGIPLSAALSIASGNAMEAWVGAWLLLRVAAFSPHLQTRRDVLALIGWAGLLSTLLSALVGVSTLTLIGTVGPADYITVVLKWWLGDMMGVLVVAPLLLLLMSHRPQRPSLGQGLEFGLLFLSLAGVSWMIFGASALAAQGFYATSLAVFPFVIWAALRFGQWGASLVTLLVSLLAIWGTAQGTGPFVVALPVDSLVRWCAFGIVTAVTGLLLAASVAEQRQAQAALQRSNAELEQRVQARTRELAAAHAELQRESAEARRLEAQLIRLSEEQQQALGRELHDGLGQLLTSLSLMCETLRQRLAERVPPEAEALQRISELVDEATRMTRSVARGLYPVALEFGGLPAALAQLAEHARSHLGQDCHLHIDPRVRLDDPLAALNLYRVAQEAVNNAVKYSRARQLWIELDRLDGQHRLRIRDDGVGIAAQRLAAGEGLGLASMRFRAGLLGGSLTISAGGDSTPSGTTVTVLCPVVEGSP